MAAGDKTNQTFGLELSIVNQNRTKFEEPNDLQYDITPIADSSTSGNKVLDASNFWLDLVPHEQLRSINETVRGEILDSSLVLESGFIRKNKDRETLLNEESQIDLVDNLDFAPDFYCYFRRTEEGTFKIQCDSTHSVHIYHIENESQNEIETNLQNCGTGMGTSQVIAANVYPIKNTRVFTIDDSNNVLEWTQFDSLSEAMNDEYAVEIDPYSGLIKFGGEENSYVGVTRFSIADSDTTILLFSSIENLKLPTRGIIQIDSEYIRYRNRNGHSLLECERGYNGSIASAHSEHSGVSIVTNGIAPTLNQTIYLAYDSTCFGVAANTGDRVSSISATVSMEKIAIVSNNLSILSSLELTSDLSTVASNTFATMMAMKNGVPNYLNVRALDQYGNPLEGISIDVSSLLEGISLDGDGTFKTKVTNAAGDSRFTISTDNDEMFKSFYSSVSHSGSETLFSIEATPFTSTSEVLLYQIVKGDLASGTIGRVANVIDVSSSSNYFELAAQGEDNFGEGQLIVLADSTYYTFTGRLQNRRFYCDVVSSPDPSIVAIENVLGSSKITAWYTNSLNEDWSPASLNGTLMLVIENTGSSYVPLFPIEVSASQVRYDVLLPEPFPSDPTKNLGGYCIVSPKALTLLVTGRQASTGAIITAEAIIYMKLSDRVSSIVESIPGSLTLTSESFNRSGLSASNFLSINPTAVFNSLDFRFKHI